MGKIWKIVKDLAYVMACMLLCMAWLIVFVIGYMLQHTWECVLCIAVNFAISIILSKLISNKSTGGNKKDDEKQISELIDDYTSRARALNEAGQEINKIPKNLKNSISIQRTVKKADLAAGSQIDIYRDEYFEPQEREMFEKIENALGFKLFFWQKAYIITGNFRHYGATVAEILKLLTDTEKEPIDYSRPAKSNTEKVFRNELKEIQYRLAASGIKTRAVFWNCEQKRKFYDQAQKKEGLNA